MTRLLMTLDAVGGVWRYAMDLARALAPRGVETVFLGLGPAPAAAQRREAESVGRLDWLDAPLDWLAEGEAALAGVPARIAEAADRHRADLLHLNLPSQAAGIGAGRPVVAVSHSCVPTWFRAVRGSGPPPGWDWQGRLTEAGLRRADLVVAPSRSHAAALEACYGPLPRIAVVPNAVAPADEAAGGGGHAVAAGRWWDEGKGGAVIDAAAARCRWPVRLVGPLRGANGAAFEARHAEALGERSHGEALALLDGADAFVSASLYEPFGLAVAEAAARGLPLVLSAIPTFRELWDGAALFVPPGDAPALAAALDRLAEDPVLRRRLGRAARRRAARHAPEAQARAMLDLYRRLARPAPAPAEQA